MLQPDPITCQIPWWRDFPGTCFGSASSQERLAALIIAGRKRATVWNANEGCETAPGMLWTVTVADQPVAVIETISVAQRRFDDIDNDFANEEGEGDKSLAYWRSVHEDFFRKEGHFAPTMMLWCEHFRLIEALDLTLLASAEQHVALEQEEGEALLLKLVRQSNS